MVLTFVLYYSHSFIKGQLSILIGDEQLVVSTAVSHCFSLHLAISFSSLWALLLLLRLRLLLWLRGGGTRAGRSWVPRDEENLAVRLLIQLGTVDIKAFGCWSLFTEHATGALAVGAALADLVWWDHAVTWVIITSLSLV